MIKVNLFNLNRRKIYKFFNLIKENKSKANKIINWIYKKKCYNFNNMSNINLKLKKKLFKFCNLKLPKIIKKKYSVDGSIKILMYNNNKSHIFESVYIPERNRYTLCISSQIGCILNCKFCATGQKKFIRNLNTYEIIGQIICVEKIVKNKISNIVIMGMGEPLLNIKNLINSIKIMLDKRFLKFSKRKITLSTSGIIPGIDKLNNLLDIVIAISLHSSNDKLRSNIMPINKIYNIKNLLISSNNYIKNSKANKNLLTIEYILINKVNDFSENAYELIKLLKNIPSKINLIKFNNFKNCNFICSSDIRILNFYNILKKKGFITTIRKNRGYDIKASCGQLTGN